MQNKAFPAELLQAAREVTQPLYYQTQRAQNNTVKSLETALPANWILLETNRSQQKQITSKINTKAADGASHGRRSLHRHLNFLKITSFYGEMFGIVVET